MLTVGSMPRAGKRLSSAEKAILGFMDHRYAGQRCGAPKVCFGIVRAVFKGGLHMSHNQNPGGCRLVRETPNHK